MRSNICKIEKGTRDLAAILHESEKVAEYGGLSHKQGLQLRLLCEEIDGMLPKLIDDFEGDLWIDLEGKACEVHVAIRIPEFNSDKKEELIGIAKNKKNAAAVGIVGKIRDAIENFFLDRDRMEGLSMSTGMFGFANGYCEGVDYTYLWRLENYKSTVEKETQAEAWDELEKSVIASVADDVIVGVKGSCAEIVIIKNFA